MVMSHLIPDNNDDDVETVDLEYREPPGGPEAVDSDSEYEDDDDDSDSGDEDEYVKSRNLYEDYVVSLYEGLDSCDRATISRIRLRSFATEEYDLFLGIKNDIGSFEENIIVRTLRSLGEGMKYRILMKVDAKYGVRDVSLLEDSVVCLWGQLDRNKVLRIIRLIESPGRLDLGTTELEDHIVGLFCAIDSQYGEGILSRILDRLKANVANADDSDIFMEDV